MDEPARYLVQDEFLGLFRQLGQIPLKSARVKFKRAGYGYSFRTRGDTLPSESDWGDNKFHNPRWHGYFVNAGFLDQLEEAERVLMEGIVDSPVNGET